MAAPNTPRVTGWIQLRWHDSKRRSIPTWARRLVEVDAGRAATQSRSTAVALALAVGGILAAPAHAWPQTAADSALAPSPDSLAPYIAHGAPLAGHTIRWYEPLAVIGGIGLLSTLDQPIANRVRDGRSSSALSVANGWARIGTPV